MMSAGSARDETCFLFLDAAYRITDVIGDSRRLYPELPAIQAGDELRAFITGRINAGYIGLNESLNIKSTSPLETRLLELASYTLFRTYQIGPRGQVLVATHARGDEDRTILTVTASRKQVDLGNSDRFRRSASILDFDVTASGLTGFGLVEHIAYSIINAMAVPLIVLNGDGLVLAANEAAQRVFKQGRLTVDGRDRLTLAGGSVEPLLTFLRSVEFGSIVPLPAFRAQGFHYARAINTPPLGKIFVLALEDSSSPPDQIELLRRRHPALSQGEAEVALLLLSGAPPKRIAQERDASIHTVRTQVASILRKTNCHSVSAFIAVSRMASL
jgi:DNA-binding CsgD family transcriptional regulator